METNPSPYLFLGESIGFWVQTLCIIISAIAAVCVLRNNAKLARRRATIDIIINLQNDVTYNECYKSVSDLISRDICLVNYANKKHESRESNCDKVINDANADDAKFDEKAKEFSDIRFVLNRLEFIAQGIRRSAFEEDIYKDLECSNMLRLWRAVCPLVMEIRRKHGKDTYFQEIEWLSKRWSKNPVQKLNK